MIYLDIEALKEQLNTNEDYGKMVNQMILEVQDFYEHFSDNPKWRSGWGHHYFCKSDGGRLIFDASSKKHHVCEICGTAYESELLEQVWVYFYRNEAVMTLWKAAFLYRVTGDDLFYLIVRKIGLYYAEHYLQFDIHDKFDNTYEHLSEMAWGCGRIMPQGLNESIFVIKMINGLELVKDLITDADMTVYRKMFESVFELLEPQPREQGIHNITCWNHSSIGMMGLFLGDDSMKAYAFEGPYNIHEQLRDGVTEDGFWYEGSIHYNFFTLEGVSNLLFFCDLYDHDPGSLKPVVEKMLLSAYDYAFDNHQLPNPNDGWPNINLKTYAYIYAWVVRVYGKDSEVSKRLCSILTQKGERGILPLSRPYYYNNMISLTLLMIYPDLTPRCEGYDQSSSKLFGKAYFALLKHNKRLNVFLKYGHNGPSHAHPDKMNIEVIFGEDCLTRDLSNSGYGNLLCDQWHRQSASHNTVVVGGKSHTSFEGGQCLAFSEHHVRAQARDVYEGIDFIRDITLHEDGFTDVFEVYSKALNHYDYFFHVEGELLSELKMRPASLAYETDGYQHIESIQQVDTFGDAVELTWRLNKQIITTDIALKGKTLYIAKTPDNPVTRSRTTLIIGTDGYDIAYHMTWKIKEA